MPTSIGKSGGVTSTSSLAQFLATASRRTPSRPSRLPVDDDYVHNLLDHILKLETKWNEIVHANWLSTDTGAIRGWRTLRSKDCTTRIGPISTADLVDIA